MRVLGLDVGDKRIGVAVSDEMGWTAQPLKVIKRVSLEKDCRAVVQEMETFQADRVVVGLPRNMDGSLGPQAEKTKAFAQALGRLITAEVILWDERLSTQAAERVLLQADLSRAKRKKVIDKVAAGIILQGYLDRLAHQGKDR
jgi:putative Holliday junction resolvase